MEAAPFGTFSPDARLRHSLASRGFGPLEAGFTVGVADVAEVVAVGHDQVGPGDLVDPRFFQTPLKRSGREDTLSRGVFVVNATCVSLRTLDQ